MTRRPRPPRPKTQDPAIIAQWRDAAYRWPCGQCACVTNLRGLLRDVCAHCGHTHTPAIPEESPHVE